MQAHYRWFKGSSLYNLPLSLVTCCAVMWRDLHVISSCRLHASLITSTAWNTNNDMMASMAANINALPLYICPFSSLSRPSSPGPFCHTPTWLILHATRHHYPACCSLYVTVIAVMCGIQCTVAASGAASAASCAPAARRGPDAQQVVYKALLASSGGQSASGGVSVALGGAVLQLRGSSATAAVQTDEVGNALCYNGLSQLTKHSTTIFVLRPSLLVGMIGSS
jgi:hypothetical protein